MLNRLAVKMPFLLVIGVLVSTGFPMLTLSATAGNSAFERTWSRTDRPVADHQVSRTWMWGPAPFTGPMMEATSERPGVGREVQYFDKSRMERNLDPNVSEYSIWQVTNGLLAMELVSGRLQLGDNDFETRAPAQVNVAGDWDDPTGPTYATFTGLLNQPASSQGAPISSRVDRQGNVTEDPDLAARGVVAAIVVPETGHSVASPFWEFMTSSGLVKEDGPARVGQLFPNPFYATGYPVTEPYWANVKVAGTYTEVLVQVFERRVLTYTPGNPAGWQVEAGNVGRHYFEWRYGISPPAGVNGPQGSGLAPLGPSPLGTYQPSDGAATLTIANQGNTPLTVVLHGAEQIEVVVDACAGCPPPGNIPATCQAGVPSRTITLPAGSWSITVNRPGMVQPLGGVWTLLPDTGYGACFFAFR